MSRRILVHCVITQEPRIWALNTIKTLNLMKCSFFPKSVWFPSSVRKFFTVIFLNILQFKIYEKKKEDSKFLIVLNCSVITCSIPNFDICCVFQRLWNRNLYNKLSRGLPLLCWKKLCGYYCSRGQEAAR